MNEELKTKMIKQFVEIYNKEYAFELANCDRWISWCQEQKDFYGMNFHQGLRAALIFNNIKMEQFIRILALDLTPSPAIVCGGGGGSGNPATHATGGSGKS